MLWGMIFLPAVLGKILSITCTLVSFVPSGLISGQFGGRRRDRTARGPTHFRYTLSLPHLVQPNIRASSRPIWEVFGGALPGRRKFHVPCCPTSTQVFFVTCFRFSSQASTPLFQYSQRCCHPMVANEPARHLFG